VINRAEFANIARAERDLWWFRGMRRILDAALDPVVDGRSIEKVLEGGCGTGYQSLLLERDRGWRMYPLDLGWEGLEYARGMGLERLVQADVSALPFPEASFDAVVSLDVMVHFPRGGEGRAFGELVRVLRPRGLLVVRVAALDLLRSRHSLFVQESQRFTRGRLVRLARECGVRVLRATYANSLLLPVALAKFRVWEPLTGRDPASGVQAVAPWLDRLLYAPLALEAAWLRAGFNLPLGQSVLLVGEKT